MPADGIGAATANRNFGTSRWQLSDEGTSFPHARGRGRHARIHEVAAPMTEAFPPAPAGGAAPVISMRWQWRQCITLPIRAFQLNYVPVVMVYFAYGALGLV